MSDNQSRIEKIIENYENELNDKNNIISKISDELSSISTSSYLSGIPDTKYNRGDEGNDFAFPIKWGETCKKMEKSVYLEPVLHFFKNIFNTFDYYIEKPESYDSDINVKKAYDFFVKQLKRAGGLQNLLVDISYNTLVYGFSFFTPKLEVVSGRLYNLKGNYEGLKGFKFYDPTLLHSFIFNEIESDEIQKVKLFTSPKELSSQYNYSSIYDDYININANNKHRELITIDFDYSLAGYCSYGTIQGDPLGKPFLYSVYPIWKVLENMDNSFNRNLSNIGEHSFNFITYNQQEGLDESKRKATIKELKEFINNKGGIFIGSHGKIEKIESIDANEWYNFRDGMLSTIYKNKGVDIKALGLNRGATHNLAEISQSDSVITAYGIISKFIQQINNTFMKKYFDLNFQKLRTQGLCDYFQIKCEVSKGIANAENNTTITNDDKVDNNIPIELSIINKDDGQVESNTVLANGAYQTKTYANGKANSTKTAIPMSKFIKQTPNDITKFIIDTSELDRILVRSSEELYKYLLDFIKNAMLDNNLIEKALKDPSSFIRGSLLTKSQRTILFNKIKELLHSDAYSFFQYKANEILKGAGINDWSTLFGTSLEEWIENQTKKFLKNKITMITDELAAKVEKIAIDNLFNFTRGYNINTDIVEAKELIQNEIFNWKGKQLEETIDNQVIYTFQECSNSANESSSKKINMMKIRSGVLENMCKHCQKYFGVLYKQDSQGNWYNTEHSYKELPDKDCIGAKYGNKCKCYYVAVSENTLNVINNLI